MAMGPWKGSCWQRDQRCEGNGEGARRLAVSRGPCTGAGHRLGHTDVAGLSVLGAHEGVARCRGQAPVRASWGRGQLGLQMSSGAGSGPCGSSCSDRTGPCRQALQLGRGGGVGATGCKAEGMPVLCPVTLQVLREPGAFVTEVSPWCCRDGRCLGQGDTQEPRLHGCPCCALPCL